MFQESFGKPLGLVFFTVAKFHFIYFEIVEKLGP